MDWFRSHHGAPTDPKWLMIAERSRTQPYVVAAIWWALMDFASRNEDRGSIQGFDSEELAFFYKLEKETIENVIQALKDKKLIDENQRLKSWDKRQPKREDGSAERAKTWRERKRTQTNASERPEQIQSREEQIQNRTETDISSNSNSNISNVETRAREPSAAAAAENVVSDPPDKPPREIYLEELGKSFPQIGVHGRVNGKVLQMLMSWERASVIADDIREAIQHVQSRGDPVQTPVYYREIVLSFASDRQRSAHDPPSPRSSRVVGFSQGLGGQYAGSSSSRSIMDEVHAARLEAEREYAERDYAARFGKLELEAG